MQLLALSMWTSYTELFLIKNQIALDNFRDRSEKLRYQKWY